MLDVGAIKIVPLGTLAINLACAKEIDSGFAQD
jgi:hypothetical protein